MNDVIRQAVYRDAEIDINRILDLNLEHYQKERINELKQEIGILKEENLDLRERLDYYERLSEETPSIIYMDFSMIDGSLQLNSAYEDDPKN